MESDKDAWFLLTRSLNYKAIVAIYAKLGDVSKTTPKIQLLMANIKAPSKQCNRTAHFAGDPGWHAPESSDVLSSRFPNLDREICSTE